MAPKTKPRLLSSPLIIRIPFSYYLGLIREPTKKKGKRVLLGNLETLKLKVILRALIIRNP